jgi:glucokinase
MGAYGLVADIGGTHIRFATVDMGGRAHDIRAQKTLSTKDHPHIAAAARAYLADIGAEGPPEAVVFAVAGPVSHGVINLTNAGWQISADDLKTALDAHAVRVVNDFEALASAIPVFEPDDLRPIGPGPDFDPKEADGTVAVVGPGTGLGVGGLVRRDGATIPLVTEGGHAIYAPGDDYEMEILRRLRRKFPRVSGERVLSGPGLVNLYQAMAEIDGIQVPDTTPEDITGKAKAQNDSFEAKVFGRFCSILGAVAGDVGLMLGARNGVLIGGGILPDAVDFFLASNFRDRFDNKGRFASYMKAIPTALIVQPQAGLIGSAEILLTRSRR